MRVGDPLGGTDDPFPMSGEQYTLDISIISLTDVGVTEDSTLETTVEKYEAAGYRPLTPEEAVELRLQFPENQSLVHINFDHPLTGISALPDEQTINLYGAEHATCFGYRTNHAHTEVPYYFTLAPWGSKWPRDYPFGTDMYACVKVTD